MSDMKRASRALVSRLCRRQVSKADAPLRELDAIEAFEGACNRKRYDDYGVGTGGGAKPRNMLQGPGLSKANDSPGVMMMGGGAWPVKLSDFCGTIMGELDEDMVMDLYRTGDGMGLLTEVNWCRQGPSVGSQIFLHFSS